jgi:peptide/nickel transport system permease protein
MTRRVVTDQPLIFGLAFVVLQIIFAIFAPLITKDPFDQFIVARMQAPSWEYFLGTDHLGRDILARIFYGYRTSLLTCGAAVSVALLVGGSLGMFSAFYRGWFDRIIMRLMDVLFAFPIILLAIAIIAILGPNSLSASFAIAVVYIPIFARLLRGPSLVICESEYILSAKVIGASDFRIIFSHVLPNLTSIILVQTSLLLSAAILVEASLSFLGLGAQPPVPSLGQMLSEGRNFLFLNPWPAIFSGFAILFLSFGFNFLGDSLRDALDPKLKP